ncbi:BatA domain-containing protein [Adhaeribacter aquaticus]|uniref:BatA domain-containing protein n=1 Tax=Adhaeribacter aquaticus TaxID=299567 RepID=UPI00047C2B2A|nr:BatA domain-containing protein [Adhaeribacter aquaticus]
MNFLAPTFLFGLLAISIPVVIHLIELRRAKRVAFTNVAFIKEVKNITSSHRRLKHILVLLSRVFFIVFFVLMFAQPFIPENIVDQRTSNHLKIFVDNSFSLENEAETEGNNLLDIANKHLRSLIEFSGNNSRFFYVDQTNRSNIYNAFTKEKVLNHLDDVTFSANNKSPKSVFSSIAISSKEPAEIVFYSDFQRNYFNPNLLKELTPDNNYYFIHLKGTAEHNAFVDSVFLEDEFVRLNDLNKITVKLRNSGLKEIKSCQVKFFIGSQQVSALAVNIPGKGISNVTFQFKLSDPNLKQCKIVLQDFPVEFDNTYYFTLQASSKLNILDLSEQGGVPTQHLYANEPVFNYSHLTAAQFNFAKLQKADLIIVNGLNTVSMALVGNLEDFVAKGGNLIIVPPKEINGNFLQFINKLKISSSAADKSPSNTAQTELASPDKSNPFFERIFEMNHSRIDMPKGFNILRWTKATGDILKFKNGDKFLSFFKRGSGQVFLFSTPLLEEYTNFANHSLFVPVMYKIAMESFKLKQYSAYDLGSPAINFSLMDQKYSEKDVFKLVKDSVVYIPEQQVREGKLVFSIPNELNKSGFYQLTSNQKVLTDFAFNFPKQESELDSYSVTELKNFAENAKNIKILDASDEIAIKKIFSQENFGTQLWKYCLILCLIFAFFEILLVRFL